MSLSLLVQGPYILTRGLKVDRRHDPGPAVRGVVPSSRWPVMESSGDRRLSAFDRLIGFFLIVLVIRFVPDLFSPFWKPCSTGDWPWTAYGVLNRLTRDENLIFGVMFSTTLLTVEMLSAHCHWWWRCGYGGRGSMGGLEKGEDQHLFQTPPIWGYTWATNHQPNCEYVHAGQCFWCQSYWSSQGSGASNPT